MLSDGTYIVRNGKDTSLCLNAYGATDGNGANIWLYTYDASDACYVRVQNKPDGTICLVFPASGKAVDINHAKLESGTNVQQWEWHGGIAQKWKPVSTGTQIAFEGKNYDSYKLFVAGTYGTSNLVMDVAGGASGDNICIYTDDGGSDQTWIFVPANPAPAGTYQIVSALDTSKVLNVEGGSSAGGARVILWDRVRENNSIVWLRDFVDGACKIQFVHSMQYMSLPGQKTVQGAQLEQYTDDGGADMRWVLYPSGSIVVDGVQYPAYEISNVSTEGTTMCVDVRYGKATNGNVIQMYAQHHGNSQRFAFVPTQALDNSSLPTPDNLELQTPIEASNGVFNTSVSIWDGTAAAYQGRYRFRARAAGKAFDAWSLWFGMGDSTPANDGWGSVGKPNAPFTRSKGRCTGSYALKQLPALTHELVEMEVEQQLRAFTDTYEGNDGLYASSKAIDSVTKLGYTPQVTVSGVELMGDGIKVSYITDINDGATATVDVSLSFNGKHFTAQETRCETIGDSLIVPWSKLSKLPDKGNQVSCTLHVLTGYGVSAYAVFSGSITEHAGRVTDNVNISESDHGTYLVKLATKPTASVSVRCVLEDGTIVQAIVAGTDSTSTTYELLTPLNTASSLFVSVNNGNTWSASKQILQGITSHAYTWQFLTNGKADWCVLDYAIDKPPAQADKLGRDTETYETSGRKFRAYRLGYSYNRDVSVSGAIVLDIVDHGTYEAFDRLLSAGHATFRNHRGQVMNVAVTSVSRPLEQSKYFEVSVTQYQETR